MTIPVPHKIVKGDEDSLVAFIPGHPEPLLATESHPCYAKIVAAVKAGKIEGLAQMFDVEAAVRKAFKRLSERVSVRDGQVLLDGDAVTGIWEDLILAFLDSGSDFKPLVNFYEKVLTNPLGAETKNALGQWMTGQGKSGGVTITPEGNVLGYKSVFSNGNGKYRPSRRGAGIVNGVEIPAGEYILQEAGDVVEMPRSKVLHRPSQACGDGLHIGTWGYARGFQGDTKILVEFNPRDVVSVPTHENKIRVCRYRVVKVVTEPLSAPLFEATATPRMTITTPAAKPKPDPAKGQIAKVPATQPKPVEPPKTPAALYGDLRDGDKVTLSDGQSGTVRMYADGSYTIEGLAEAVMPYGNKGRVTVHSAYPEVPLRTIVSREAKPGAARQSSDVAFQGRPDGRSHGTGGSTGAKGRGRHPAQDALGRFSAGRPASRRGAGGRFVKA